MNLLHIQGILVTFKSLDPVIPFILILTTKCRNEFELFIMIVTVCLFLII